MVEILFVELGNGFVMLLNFLKKFLYMIRDEKFSIWKFINYFNKRLIGFGKRFVMIYIKRY